MKFAIRSTLSILLAAGATLVHAATDLAPFDSIENPLAKLASTVPDIQQRGDAMNRVPGRVRVNQAGYRLLDVVKGWEGFYYVDSTGSVASTFSIINDSNAVKASGLPLTSKGLQTSGHIKAFCYYNAQTSSRISKPGYSNDTGMAGSRSVGGTVKHGYLPKTLVGGIYRIVVGKDTSQPFIVSDNVYGMARDAVLKFFGIARSGDYQSWFHPASHLWDGWLYDSTAKNSDGSFKYKGALTGGWYDCGNHLKESRTMSYTLASLGMLAATMPDRDVDHYGINQDNVRSTDGTPDVLREGWVGSQFALKSYRLAKGVVDSMYLSVGNPPGGTTPPGHVGVDFLWWGRPENQDAVEDINKGGRHERFPVINWGSPSLADWAAGLAFVSRLYKPYNKPFADTALLMAKAMYKAAKATNARDGGSDYDGESVVVDDLALAAVALLWATQDSSYLNDLAYTNNMVDGKGGTCGTSDASYFTTRFSGGYLGCASENYFNPSSGTAWANVNTWAIYSFIKLILVNPDTAAHYGIFSAQRDTLLSKAISRSIGTEISASTRQKSITLPIGDKHSDQYSTTGNTITVAFDSLWNTPSPGSGAAGWYNKYIFGHFADMYMYWDEAGIADGKDLPGYSASTNWKRDSVQQLIINGMNYMLGTNAMDLSYIMGVGHKNPNHPHHRAANPEGKNVPGATYYYRIPVGGLWGGPSPQDTVVSDLWENQVSVSEANCPDAAAAVLIPLMGLARSESEAVPVPTVSVLYTTDSSAMVQVTLNKYGYVKLNYGTDSTTGNMTSTVWSDTGTTLRITIKNLAAGVKYYFSVTSFDVYGNSGFSHAWVTSSGDSILYNFTTKSSVPSNATYANIKVCNVTADSAEVMWYTPNGNFLSSVIFADSADWVAGKYNEVDTDETGPIAVKFHRVLMTGLKEQTTYYFQVGEPGSYNSIKGCFRTPIQDVKFDIRASRYNWPEGPDNTYTGSHGSVMRALSIGVTNQDSKTYDSLMLRLYMRGTKFAPDSMVKFGARCDIGFKYRSDGYIDSGFESRVDYPLRRSYATKMDPACPDSAVCDWYFNVPLYDSSSSTEMESQARFRLDLLFDTHKYEYDNNDKKFEVYPDLMSFAPPHDPFAIGTKDWSFRTHMAGADNGLSPVAFAGVSLADKNAMDDSGEIMPLEPYIAIYRKNTFVYGYSPSAVEQATKRTVYALDLTFDPPFDQQNGSVITVPNGARSIRVTGKADVYDQLLKAAKGYITSIWVNGNQMPASALSSDISRQSDGTWKFDIPVSLASGTNTVNVTIFAGSDSADTTPTGTCQEGKGCAFAAREWLVNSISNQTTSILSVVDGSGAIVGPLVTPDSSFVNVRVVDNDNNVSATTKDKVQVTLTDLRSGLASVLVLTETGISTGIFESGQLSVTGAPTVGKISVPRGDSVLVKYMDVSDSSDTSQAYLYAKAVWPTPVRAGLFRDCGGTYMVKALFDRSFAAGGWDSARAVLQTGIDSIVDKMGAAAITADAAGTTLTISLPAGISSGSMIGRLDLKEANGQGGWIVNSIAIRDSVGPWIDSAKIVENLNGNATDSVFFWASEPFTSTSPWPFLVHRAGVAVTSASFAGSSPSQLLDAQAGKYLLVLPSGTLLAGDSVRFDPSLVADSKGNAALDCPGGRKVQVISVRFAALRASLSETCGGAYSVAALFNKPFPVSGGYDTGFVTLSSGTKTIGPFAVAPGAIAKDARGKVLTLPLPGLTYGSNWTGRLDIRVLNDSGSWYTVSVPVSDSVGPWIDSAKIVENLTGNPNDTLSFWSSEPLSAGSLPSWHFLVGRNGVALPASSFAGAVVTLSDAVTNKYQVILPAGAVAAGDSLRFDPTLVSDVAGNAAQNCPNAKRVTVLSRPAPFSRAWILDANGDGRADRMVVVFGKVVQAKDLPDLVQVRFGTGDSSRTVAATMAQVTDSVLTLNLVTPFPFGITRGSAIDGSGSISLSKSGMFTGPYALADSVGPALLSAGLRYGSSYDTLDLNFSEPVRRAAGSGWLMAQPSLELGIIARPDSLSATHWRLPVNSGSVVPGDSVRPLPTEQWSENRSGRTVASSHPWIPVTGGERVPLGGWFRDVNGDGAVDQATVVFAKAPKTRPGMMLLWPSLSGGFDTAVVDSGAWTLNSDGITATISVGPFAKGVTASPTTDLGRWVSGGWWNFPLNDSVPPVLVSAQVRYASQDGMPDTLRVRWSERISWSGAGSLVRHLYQGIETPVSAQPGLVYDADSLGAGLLLDTGVALLRRGDSVAFSAATVTDRLGNAVQPTTRWVPLKFGLRPARLDFKLQSYLEYLGWDPRPGPAAQVWVRARGDAQWLFPDSTPVRDTTHTISATLTLNRILSGAAYIYDNAGVYVTSVDFSGVTAMAAQNKLPMDPSGMYQMKITWSGLTDKGTLAGSGIYLMRLVLKDSSPDNPHGLPAIVNRVYKLGFKRSTK